MSPYSQQDGRPHPYPRESFRLTFHFTKDSVELVSQERLHMIAPPSVGVPPVAGTHSGTWFELRDARDGRLATGNVHDPFRTGFDHHFPDGHIERVSCEITEGQFDVLLPAVPGATSVALVSSEFPSAGTDGHSVEVACFPFDQGAR